MNLIKLSATASTNTCLKKMASEISLEDETVVWADTQTEGRGQRGNSWYSETGKSLTFSVLKRFSELPAETGSAINFAVSLGIMDALKSLEIPSVAVKWPNDIMSYDKKICGILVQNQLKGGLISSSVIGIGINVNNLKLDSLPNAGSMRLVANREFDLKTVFDKVVESVLKELRLLSLESSEELRKNYEYFLFRKDKRSEFLLSDGSERSGVIRGVNRLGQLEVELNDGLRRSFQLKEISLKF